MAIIDVNFDLHRATVQFSGSVPERCRKHAEVLFLARDPQNEQVYFKIPVRIVEPEDTNWFILVAHPEKIISIVMSNYGESFVGFIEGEAVVYAERVTLTAATIKASVDPLRLNTHHVKLPEKPARVAVFTQTYNEGAMLAFWERHYAALFGHENLFVLDNASDDGSVEKLHPKTSIVHLPKAPVDHEHFAQLHGYFQRMLLLRYEWVIKVDTDELLATALPLPQLLASTPPGTYKPETAVEVVHHTGSEQRFDFSGTVGQQRSHFVQGTPLLIRPIISSTPTTWTSGNHLCHEMAVPLPGLITAHLKYFDLDFLLSKNTKWSRMTQTVNEVKTCATISELQKLGLAELFALSVKEIADRLADPALELPPWFTQRI